MKPKRIVITGGPGSGKTTLVRNLENKGFSCMHEVSRKVIQEAQSQGIDQLFLSDPLLFSERLLEGRLVQFDEADQHDGNILFYDRGLPDITAYLDYSGTAYPKKFNRVCTEYKYDGIFVLPPWESIYEQDNERYESFAEAERIYRFLVAAYSKYQYNVQKVPMVSVNDRIDYILNQLKGGS